MTVHNPNEHGDVNFSPIRTIDLHTDGGRWRIEDEDSEDE